METSKTKQSQQGQVSALAPEPKDSKQEHLELGVAEVLKKVSCYAPAFRLEVLEAALNQAAIVTEEQAEEQEQPAELSIDQLTQERLKSYYKNLDPRTKLAILTLSRIQSLDGINFQFHDKEGRLYDEIWDDLESVCIETFHKEPDHTALGVINSLAAIGKTDEDVWLAGVWEALRMVIQNC